MSKIKGYLFVDFIDYKISIDVEKQNVLFLEAVKKHKTKSKKGGVRVGAGRPKIDKNSFRTTLSLSVSDTQKSAIEKMAEAQNKSVSELFQSILKSLVKK